MHKRILISTLFLLCCGVSAMAQLLPPKEPFSKQVWQAYTHNLLKKITKNTKYADLATEITIKIEDQSEADASSLVDDKEIFLTRGRINLIDDKAEFIGVVAHELGHIALKHSLAQARRFIGGDGGGVIVDTDFPLFEKQEVEADQFAVELLRLNLYDPCARYRGFLKLLEFFEVTNQEDPGPFNTILLRRLEILRKPCEQSK